MEKTFKIVRAFLVSFMLLLTLFFTQTLGFTMRSIVEISTLGKADCRIWSQEIPMMTCSEAPRFLHFAGGTTFGEIYVTSEKRELLTDGLIQHEMLHREQERRYGIMFIPLYISEEVKPGCNTWEEEASFTKGGYTDCMGKEKYHK